MTTEYPLTPTPQPSGPEAATSPGAIVRPLSFGQKGLELQQQAALNSPIFNVPAALELTGRLDQQALRRALTRIVERHDVLRTTLVSQGDRPAQVVHPPQPIELPVHDLRNLPMAQRAGAAQALLDTAAAAPFDLRREPGLRCLLVVLDIDRHVFFWNMHHIACDGWSKSIFAREISQLYTAFRSDGTDELPQLEATYGDFVAWQRALPPDLLDSQLAYWRRQLAGVADLPGLSPAHGAPQPVSRHGAASDFQVGRETRRAVEDLAGRSGATVFMVLHAALLAVLHRISGHHDLVVNVPYGNRPEPRFEPLIGFFVNVLALRSHVHGDPAFNSLLSQVQTTALDGYENSSVPFQRVTEQVAAQHAGRVGPLHEISLAFQNLPYQQVRLANLEVDRWALTRVDIRYDLEMHVWEDDAAGGLAGRLLYRPDLFEPATADAWTAAYTAALQAVVSDPGARLSQLKLPALPSAVPPVTYRQDLREVDAPQVAPRTAAESAVWGIWAELLHREDIGVTDNFMAIGGHSLLVAMMVGKIRETLGVSLPVQTIFGDPTIEGIAAAVEAERG
ncbi:condensation domain-containing protein [Streptomyces sp. NPDC056061]|uniref:condensation domain-containing protein n=1 Tax=Streptomyces sp. NPDC056061 TaxID=3345700 RepID=UPI0035DBE347